MPFEETSDVYYGKLDVGISPSRKCAMLDHVGCSKEKLPFIYSCTKRQALSLCCSKLVVQNVIKYVSVLLGNVSFAVHAVYVRNYYVPCVI